MYLLKIVRKEKNTFRVDSKITVSKSTFFKRIPQPHLLIYYAASAAYPDVKPAKGDSC